MEKGSLKLILRNTFNHLFFWKYRKWK